MIRYQLECTIRDNKGLPLISFLLTPEGGREAESGYKTSYPPTRLQVNPVKRIQIQQQYGCDSCITR